MTLLTSNSNQVQRVQSKPEYMEDTRRRQQTKLQSFFQVEEQKHTTKSQEDVYICDN